MKFVLLAVNIILSALITGFILLQGRGAGLGSAWGGAGELFQTRRGIEKFTLRITIALILIFFIVSIANIFLN